MFCQIPRKTLSRIERPESAKWRRGVSLGGKVLCVEACGCTSPVWPFRHNRIFSTVSRPMASLNRPRAQTAFPYTTGRSSPVKYGQRCHFSLSDLDICVRDWNKRTQRETIFHVWPNWYVYKEKCCRVIYCCGSGRKIFKWITRWDVSSCLLMHLSSAVVIWDWKMNAIKERREFVLYDL